MSESNNNNKRTISQREENNDSDEIEDCEYGYAERCLICNCVAVDDDHAVLNNLPNGLGKTQFCDRHFGIALKHMTIQPPLRYLLAIPLSKKSKAPRIVMDTNHIEEFKQWCTNNTGIIPYRFGIYCNHEMDEEEQKEWKSGPQDSDIEMNESDYDDYNNDYAENVMYYWPEGGAEDYEYVINSYNKWEPHCERNAFNIWTYNDYGVSITIQSSLWNYIKTNLNQQIKVLEQAKKRICNFQ